MFRWKRFKSDVRFSHAILKNSKDRSRNRYNGSHTTFSYATIGEKSKGKLLRGIVSPRTIRKLQNMRYVTKVLRKYYNLQRMYKGISADGKINHNEKLNFTMRHGLPNSDPAYILRCYDQLMKFIKQHKNDRPKTTTRKVADRLSLMVHRQERYNKPTKAQMYGLHIPKSIKVEPVMYNGERTNIPLSEVLS